MNLSNSVVLASILFGLGCASARHDAEPAHSASAVRVIQTEQIGSRKYDLLEVLEDSEMIAGSSLASIQARVTARLQKQAAKLGADAIIVTCSSAQQGVVSCRGAAIRWRDDETGVPDAAPPGAARRPTAGWRGASPSCRSPG